MAFLTRDALRTYPDRIAPADRIQASYSVRTKTASTQVFVFLSHSHKDADIISPALVLLGTQGVIVYVDWKDPSMPPMTSPATARQLKQRISQCRKFVLLATNNALDSRWVPWELGVSDSTHGMENTAILPVTEQCGDWRGSEYIGIYSRIETASDGRWAVFESGQTSGVYLSDWLRR